MSASAASLKVESLVAAPLRALTLTTVGGSVKLWRIATSSQPSRSGEEKLVVAGNCLRRRAFQFEAVEAPRARVIDRPDQRA